LNLIWDEYLNFLENNNINISKYGLKEGYYWLDNQIVKAYDTQGNIHKIIRLKIDDDLKISIKTEYKNKPFEIESWDETIKRNMQKLILLETKSLSLIQHYIENHKDLIPIILSSGGKDSSAVAYLVRRVCHSAGIIFNNTTLDVADTYLYIKQQENVKIINPKEGFYQWRERANFVGNRISRACCTLFKEGAMIDVLDEKQGYLFFMGMRNKESNTRSNYGDEWKNKKWGDRNWQGVLPIREWTEEEIWMYTLWRNIPINPKYKKGYSRVGCAVACPYYTKSTWVLDRYWYPVQYKRWHDILDKDFVKNNKDITLNCTQSEYHTCWNGGIYRNSPTEDVIEQFSNRNGLDINVAAKYFNHTCKCCNKKIKSKEVLAMNMKYSGRNTTKFYCKKHLMKMLNDMYVEDYTNEDWDADVKKFKIQGCKLF